MTVLSRTEERSIKVANISFVITLLVLLLFLPTLIFEIRKFWKDGRLENSNNTISNKNNMSKEKNEPVWKKVLHKLYVSEPSGELYGAGQIGFWSDLHPLAKSLKIKGIELGNSVSFISKLKLINGYLDGKSNEQLELTQEGLDFAVQNEKFYIDNLNQSILSTFTAILGLATFWGIFRILNFKFITDNQMWYDILFLIAILIFFIQAMAIVVRRQPLFK